MSAIIIIAAVLLGLIPASIASKKKRSFVLWWIYGAALWIVALPHALLLKDNGRKCRYCAERIRDEARVCPHCQRDLVSSPAGAGTSTAQSGRSAPLRVEYEKKPIGVAGILGIAICGLVALHFSGLVKPSTSSSSDAAPAKAEAPARPKKPVITAAIFSDLTPGIMTYDALSKIIGPGELQASTVAGGVTIENYDWANEDGSNMSLTFENGRLTQKVQAGLR